ncbi:MAG: adenosine deaminase [Gemmatimonadetes bacterium]|nr:adenosine deaminase [Gemmatimonadota bacterium]
MTRAPAPATRDTPPDDSSELAGDRFWRRLHRLPKTDLHIHLDGSVRPLTLIELARHSGIRLPVDEPAALARYMHVTDARDLVDYLARFEITLSVLQTADALERVAFELVEDAAAENVRYMEVRFSPLLNTRGGLDMYAVVEAVLRGLRRGEAATGARTAVILCALRNLDPRTSIDIAQVAVAFKGRGVVAFDLAGPEKGYPPAVHRDAFRLAARASMPVTVHAGEAFGPESIHQALHDCGARRIGHGTRLHEDPELMEYVNNFRIPIEICLTSNVQTRVAETFHTHPLRRFFETGLVVSLNTDNRLMSATTMTDEFWRAHHHLGLNWAQLSAMALMGFESAFLPHAERTALVANIRREIAALDESPA